MNNVTVDTQDLIAVLTETRRNLVVRVQELADREERWHDLACGADISVEDQKTLDMELYDIRKLVKAYNRLLHSKHNRPYNPYMWPQPLEVS